MTKDKSKYVSFLKENRTKEQAQEIYNQRIADSREVFEKFSDQFETRPCPVCGSDEFKPLEPFDSRYGVVGCLHCTTNYVSPCPSYQALDYYYNNCLCNQKLGALLKSRVGKKGVILSERSRSVLDLIDTLLMEREEINVLEIGSNSGAFLHELHEGLTENGREDRVLLMGIDIDQEAVNNPVSDKITLHHSSAESFTSSINKKFDLILHFELIEHLADPFGFIKAVKSLLREGGCTYFHTPNALGLDNQALKYNDFRPLAHGIFPPMHLQAFTTQNITHFLLRAGLKVGDISTPGNFDVDIVRQFLEEESEFSELLAIEDEYALAVVQTLLKNLGASSHLSVLAYK